MGKVLAKKVVLTHPETGTETRIESSIYEPFKAAIIKSLKGSRGKLFTDLTEDVVKSIRQKMPDFKRSIPWYTISIRHDLETRGIVETYIEKGKKLSRLRK